MARKSNKTAHVLNLLAGNDAQNPAEDAVAEENSAAANARNSAAPAQPASAGAAPAPATGQNISVIDTTGEDPVAELIQQRLFDEFEKQSPSPEPAGEPVAEMEAAANVDVASELTAADSASEAPAVNATVASEPATAGSTAAAPAVNATVASEPTAAGNAAAAPANDTSSPAAATSPANDASIPAPTATPSAATEAAVNLEAALEPAAKVPESITVPGPASAPASEPISIPAPEPVSATSAPESVSVPGPGPTTVPKQEPAPEPEPEPEFAYLNVMEAITKDKIIYFMRQFGVCTCDRCIADTVALTLNGVLPKYIVTTPAAVDPLLSYYTNRLISDVTVEATKACMIVKEHPRH